MKLPARVTVVEVGPRDGFQSEKTFIPTELKVEVIDLLARAGLRKIETTSFVSPKVVPQMADAAELLAGIERVPGTTYSVLVPNLKGARRAVAAGCDAMRLVVCASEAYNQRNVGMPVADSMAQCREIQSLAKGSGVRLEVVFGLSFGCPFEGEVPEDRVVSLAAEATAMGIREISIADSVGVANPLQVESLVSRLRRELPETHLSLHIHNTRGLGLANVVAGLQAGIDAFDAGLGGLGGCPIYPGATGNVPTEDLVNMCEEMGIETGVDIDSVRAASQKIADFLARALPSYVLRFGTRKQLYARNRADSPKAAAN